MIFTVTTLNLEKKRSRTVGYFLSLEEAKRCVEENWGDIYEMGWYPEAVIEEVEAGLYPSPFEFAQYFYRWEGNPDDGCYKPCDAFEGAEEVTGFCLIG